MSRTYLLYYRSWLNFVYNKLLQASLGLGYEPNVKQIYVHAFRSGVEGHLCKEVGVTQHN